MCSSDLWVLAGGAEEAVVRLVVLVAATLPSGGGAPLALRRVVAVLSLLADLRICGVGASFSGGRGAAALEMLFGWSSTRSAASGFVDDDDGYGKAE